MIKTVTIQEFDKSVLNVGDFITFCNTKKNFSSAERNDYIIVEGTVFNGIIKYVSAEYVTITLFDGDVKRITLDNILRDERRVLGTMKSAVPLVVAPPETPPVVVEEEDLNDVPEGTSNAPEEDPEDISGTPEQ